jgi:hypothetical protein
MVDKKATKTTNQLEKQDTLAGMFNTEDDLVDNTQLIFDQYKLYVELADRISSRRATTNSFYLTANSFLFVALGILMTNDLEAVVPIILTVGIFISISWWLLIIYYKNLNSSKYEVINAIEEKLPVKGLLTEWQIYKQKRKPFRKRGGLTFIEQWIPISLLFLYSISLILLLIVFILVNANIMSSPFG